MLGKGKEPPVPVNTKQKTSINSTHHRGPDLTKGKNVAASGTSEQGQGPGGSVQGPGPGPGPGPGAMGFPWRRVLVTQGCMVTIEPLQSDTLYEITGKRKWWTDVDGNTPSDVYI